MIEIKNCPKYEKGICTLGVAKICPYNRKSCRIPINSLFLLILFDKIIKSE